MGKKQKKENREAMKVITLGESGTGKTSIIRRYIHNIFDENNLSTIGLNFSFKEIKLKDGNTISLKLIDTAGQEKYRALAKSYFKNVDAVLFVFSIGNQDTFDNIRNFINLFKENCSGEAYVPKYLVGNKSDQEKEISNDMINQFKEEYKDFKYYETSAKNNEGIEELFQDLAEDLYKILVKEGGKRRNNDNKLKYYKTKSNKGNCICSSASEFTKYKD